jgi:hypothetical protein
MLDLLAGMVGRQAPPHVARTPDKAPLDATIVNLGVRVVRAPRLARGHDLDRQVL